MVFTKKYEFIKDPPKEIVWEEYEKVSIQEYYKLLESSSDNEAAFQLFFEENPSYVPGALELFGQSGHYPHMHTLISQPQIGGPFKRSPDFLWLANDSLTFTPVFIEIEKPAKVMYTKGGDMRAEFSQAIGQIYEWQTILNKPTNQLLFFDFFNIPQSLRERDFKPQFLLVYGRRDEYETNELLRGKRAAVRKDNIDIMSFDRLRPIRDYYEFTSSQVRNKEYWIKNIPPTFRYRPDCAKELVSAKGFQEAILHMRHTSEARKEFLNNRYSYWSEYGGLSDMGILSSGEGE
ncbi:Shedu anti-phage system protein SduA domain-containing protein [Paenibacillus montanisoli]|uniref:Shedu anti-phage system protein SduA domain-containing protein n=1 Tax=Paenibacillus montanisoli TaxID=2081970 RepID=UPI0014030537|nr:Shedu anti-phage system protein SduA domain-containing protein [Paenibacillus montanisoli]